MHARVSVNSACFPGATLAELGACWHRMGARSVSLIDAQIGADPAPVRATLHGGGFRLETIFHRFLPDGQLVNDAAAWDAPRATLAQLIAAAAALGARSIYMLTGGRGAMSWEEAAEAFSAAIAPCVARARDAGVALMIENASALYADIHIAHSLRDTVTLAEMANIGVNIDLFGGWTEAGLQQTIERAMPRCHLVQVGDYVLGDRSLPARAVPGDGAVPLKRILGWVLRAGYQGNFDLELLGPRIDREGHLAAVERAARNVGAILAELGA